MNKVIFIGRLCADPEMRSTTCGKEVCSFRLAVDRQFSKEKSTDFFPCEAWDKTAGFISKYFSKGSMIAIEGEIRNAQYTKNGSEIKFDKIVITGAHFCGQKTENKPTVDVDPDDLDEEYPF